LQNATPRGENATPSGTLSSGFEKVVRWCVVGVALVLAVLLAVWLTK
jgi:hypothetical protein